MNALCNGADAFRSVIYGIETGHCGQQRLCGTDVGSRFLAFDVLLAGLQRHAVTRLSVFVFRPADDTSRHIALVLVACGEVSGRRAAVEHRRAQPLGSSEYDVRSPFSRRGEQGEAQYIGGHSHFTACGMRFLHKSAVVFYISVGVRVLQYAGEDVRSRFQFIVFTRPYLDALRDGAGGDDSQCLREYVFVHKHDVGSRLLHIARTQRVHHRNGFRGGGRFIQQGAVGKRHAGKVANDGLEIQQGFQPSLRHFRLIRRIGGVPNGILEYVALDYGRRNGVVPTHADIGSV